MFFKKNKKNQPEQPQGLPVSQPTAGGSNSVFAPSLNPRAGQIDFGFHAATPAPPEPSYIVPPPPPDALSQSPTMPVEWHQPTAGPSGEPELTFYAEPPPLQQSTFEPFETFTPSEPASFDPSGTFPETLNLSSMPAQPEAPSFLPEPEASRPPMAFEAPLAPEPYLTETFEHYEAQQATPNFAQSTWEAAPLETGMPSQAPLEHFAEPFALPTEFEPMAPGSFADFNTEPDFQAMNGEFAHFAPPEASLPEAPSFTDPMPWEAASPSPESTHYETQSGFVWNNLASPETPPGEQVPMDPGGMLDAMHQTLYPEDPFGMGSPELFDGQQAFEEAAQFLFPDTVTAPLDWQEEPTQNDVLNEFSDFALPETPAYAETPLELGPSIQQDHTSFNDISAFYPEGLQPLEPEPLSAGLPAFSTEERTEFAYNAPLELTPTTPDWVGMEAPIADLTPTLYQEPQQESFSQPDPFQFDATAYSAPTTAPDFDFSNEFMMPPTVDPIPYPAQEPAFQPNLTSIDPLPDLEPLPDLYQEMPTEYYQPIAPQPWEQPVEPSAAEWMTASPSQEEWPAANLEMAPNMLYEDAPSLSQPAAADSAYLGVTHFEVSEHATEMSSDLFVENSAQAWPSTHYPPQAEEAFIPPTETMGIQADPLAPTEYTPEDNWFETSETTGFIELPETAPAQDAAEMAPNHWTPELTTPIDQDFYATDFTLNEFGELVPSSSTTPVAGSETFLPPPAESTPLMAVEPSLMILPELETANTPSSIFQAEEPVEAAPAWEQPIAPQSQPQATESPEPIVLPDVSAFAQVPAPPLPNKLQSPIQQPRQAYLPPEIAKPAPLQAAPAAMNPSGAINQDPLESAWHTEETLSAPPAKQSSAAKPPINFSMKDMEVIALCPLDADRRLLIVHNQGVYALMGQVGMEQPEISVLKLFEQNPIAYQNTFTAVAEAQAAAQGMFVTQVGTWHAIISTFQNKITLHTELG